MKVANHDDLSNRYSVTPAALSGRYHSQQVHAGVAGKRAANGRNGLRDAHRSNDDDAADYVDLRRKEPAELEAVVSVLPPNASKRHWKVLLSY